MICDHGGGLSSPRAKRRVKHHPTNQRRSLRFRNTIDAIENEHDHCIDSRERAGAYTLDMYSIITNPPTISISISISINQSSHPSVNHPPGVGAAAGGGKGGQGNGGWPVRTCSFCEEIVNERFREAISPEEMRVKQEALSLLEGMLTVRVDGCWNRETLVKNLPRPPGNR